MYFPRLGFPRILVLFHFVEEELDGRALAIVSNNVCRSAILLLPEAQERDGVGLGHAIIS
jgi:hypothetical protein